MTDVQQVLQQALELGDEERWDEMATMLAEALQQVPDDPYLLCWLGVAEQELGNDGAAYEYFRRCLAEDPLDPHLLALAGGGLASFDDPAAEQALRAAALSGPEIPLTRIQYGGYLARAGLFDEALEHLRAAVELAPEDPTTHGELGIAQALKGDVERAIEALEHVLELAPDDSWTRLLVGLLYSELGGEEEAAAEMLIQAAEERDDDMEAQVLAALAAAAVGWEDAAHGALARAEYATSGGDARLLEEAEERLLSGSAAARTMLRQAVGPSILRDRLRQPL